MTADTMKFEMLEKALVESETKLKDKPCYGKNQTTSECADCQVAGDCKNAALESLKELETKIDKLAAEAKAKAESEAVAAAQALESIKELETKIDKLVAEAKAKAESGAVAAAQAVEAEPKTEEVPASPVDEAPAAPKASKKGSKPRVPFDFKLATTELMTRKLTTLNAAAKLCMEQPGVKRGTAYNNAGKIVAKLVANGVVEFDGKHIKWVA